SRPEWPSEADGSAPVGRELSSPTRAVNPPDRRGSAGLTDSATGLVRGNPDSVSVRVGQDAETHARRLLLGLNDRAAKLLGAAQCGSDIRDCDKEQHLVLGALARTDRHRRTSLRTGVHERVAREPALGGHLPVKQLTKELTSGVGVLRTDLGVDHWMRH